MVLYPSLTWINTARYKLDECSMEGENYILSVWRIYSDYISIHIYIYLNKKRNSCNRQDTTLVFVRYFRLESCITLQYDTNNFASTLNV